MLELMLLRHAKSSVADAGEPDVERPLNDRGRNAASAMANYMAAHKMNPELVLCSPARRARETNDIVIGKLRPAPVIHIEPEIYDFGDGAVLLNFLRHKAGTARSVLLVGHNPSIANLAGKLVGHGDATLRANLAEKFPTAALAVINFDLMSWAELEKGTGSLVRFVRPKDIIETDD
jgi:phosphohistidine phosphatase